MSAPEPLTLSGHAALTGVWYPVGGKFMEQLSRGAFKRTLSENPDVVLTLEHGAAGSGLPLARTRAGNLTLGEDAQGLHFSAVLDPEDPDSQLLSRKLANGSLDGQCSFMFQATSQEWSEDYKQRTVRGASLHKGDVSIVVQGANDQTYASMTAPRTSSATQERRAIYVPDLATRYRLRLMALETRRQ